MASGGPARPDPMPRVAKQLNSQDQQESLESLYLIHFTESDAKQPCRTRLFTKKKL